MGDIYAVYKYKCRRCGEVYSDTESGWDELNVHSILTNSIYRAGNIGKRVAMTDVHKCSKDAMGIADLIGVEKREFYE
jgi:hypothetical protein